MKKNKLKTTFTAGSCCMKECSMTLVMYIGGGQHVCWLHAIKMGLYV